jgi:hypothetical protein
MAKLRLHILFNGSSMQLVAEEEKIKSVMSMYQNAIEQDNYDHRIIFASNMVIRVSHIHAMFTSPADQITIDEEIKKNIVEQQKKQNEADWWKRGDKPPGEDE